MDIQVVSKIFNSFDEKYSAFHLERPMLKRKLPQTQLATLFSLKVPLVRCSVNFFFQKRIIIYYFSISNRLAIRCPIKKNVILIYWIIASQTSNASLFLLFEKEESFQRFFEETSNLLKNSASNRHPFDHEFLVFVFQKFANPI